MYSNYFEIVSTVTFLVLRTGLISDTVYVVIFEYYVYENFKHCGVFLKIKFLND